MIDIHNHILPALDDGARDMEQTLRMVRQAESLGVTTLIATPHHANGTFINESEVIRRSVDEVNQRIQERGMTVKVLPGQEVRWFGRLMKDLENGKLVPLADSRYLLLEFPSSYVPAAARQTISSLVAANYIPIIAHPERNRAIFQQPSLLYDFIREGALSQVTSHSITGLFGKKIQKFSLDLCRKHCAHFIASDAHHETGRCFNLPNAYEYIGEHLGADYVEGFISRASLVVRNQNIETVEPIRPARKWFGFF
ncbi:MULTISPECIES: tyrosine-protein phosphatase [Paenibacillus]|uniref:tyrosine-protein phosphatase n=1 Tax=Paenibacillus TaxID=44249 RepID=UPI0022B86FBA|nr:CpsB/CapC family capsule biosynthesis tyrosine phosphatase [Paenibacillus caseinilyticus]MCZ8519335.1 capsular biosynthesis protein [Paenibacillus caseinilyticus]